MHFINDLNLRKQAQDLGVKIWQTPGFLFTMMGVITVVVMTATYFISKKYDDPSVLVISESLIVSLIFIIGTSIVRFVEQIVRLNKAKTEFVSVASHQLRTPLSAVKWEMELILSKLKKGLSEKQIEKLENIAILNQRMIKLVNDLLDVARIDQDRFFLRKNKFDFTKIIEDVVRENYVNAKKRHISIATVFSPKLSIASGDAEKIKLVVENLVNNAIKYTTSGGKIEIRLFPKGDYFIFEIRDDGVGIPEEQTNRVFEKFFRSDNAARYQTEGTGLGLYIAKNIVEQSGGKIWFQTVENIGSVFSFSLPIPKIEIDKDMKKIYVK